MTDGEILDIAVRQSATDSACRPEDFFKGEHVVVRSRADMGARKYLSLPFALDLASYGNNVVASADEALIPVAEAYLRGRRAEACFETPALHELDAMLLPFGLRTCFQAEYFLPDLNAMREIACAYPTRTLAREAFSELYLPQWSNALCKARKKTTSCASGRTTAIRSSVWRAVPPTANECGRSASTFCPHIGRGASPPRSFPVWRRKRLPAAKCRSIAPRGRISRRKGPRSRAGSDPRGCSSPQNPSDLPFEGKHRL